MSLISREPETNTVNWPIYSLANYENSGTLLDLCRSSFERRSCSPTTTKVGQQTNKDNKESCVIKDSTTNYFLTNANNQQLTTSDYLTGEESSSTTNNISFKSGEIRQREQQQQQEEAGGKLEIDQKQGYQNEHSAKVAANNGKRCKVLWWQLIESISSSNNQERKQQAEGAQSAAPTSNWQHQPLDHELSLQLLHLCFNLHKAVSTILEKSSFLIVSPFDGGDNIGGSPSGSWRVKGSSRSLQQPIEGSDEVAATTRTATRNRPSFEGSATQSAEEEELSPANIRRLSWRRKVLEKGVKRLAYNQQEKDGEENERIAPQVALVQRRLESFGQTFSLGGNDNNIKQNNKNMFEESKSTSSSASGCKKKEKKRTKTEKELENRKEKKKKEVTILDKLIRTNPDLDKLRRSYLTSKWSKLSAKRGKYGESLIHILIINHSNEHLILLICLLHLYPMLASDIFESFKFKGVSSLHLSIAYSNERLLRYLIDVNNGINNIQASKFCVSGSLFRSPIKSLSWTTTSTLLAPSSSSFVAPPNSNDSPLITTQRQRQREQQEQQLATNARKKLTTRLSKLIRRSDKVSTTGGDNLTTAGGKQAVGSSQATRAYWCDQMDHWPTANGHAHLILFDKILAKSPESVQQNQQPLDSNALLNSSRLPIYLGDTPLAWSISFASRTLYEILVKDYKFNQNSQDSEGNTCLHLLVINNQTGWARFLIKSGANRNLLNNDNLTPLLFACHLGRFEIFNELLELSAVEFWSYSMIRCCGYPLTDLDSILISDNVEDKKDDKGKEEKSYKQNRSAMSVILESSESDNEQKSLLLSSAVVKKLLEEKWRIFARRLFYHELFLTLAHLTLMTLSISLRPTQQVADNHQHNLQRQQQQQVANSSAAEIVVEAKSSIEDFLNLLNQTVLLQDRQNMIRHLSELTTVLLSGLQLIRFADEWRRYGNVALQWTYNPLLPIFVTANLLIVTCALVRIVGALNFLFTGEENYLANLGRIEDVLLIFAAPLLWSSLLFFIAAFRVTGPFVAMIRYMIVRDLRQFSVIYLIFLYSFAQCIFFVNKKPHNQQVETISSSPHNNTTTKHWFLQLVFSYCELCMDLFKMTLGVYDLQPYRHSTLARLFFLLFIYLIPILFNMLIAMMNNTYSLIISQSERAWSFQWARTLFALERRLGEKEKSAYLRLYSINIPAPNQQASAEESAELNTDEAAEIPSYKDKTDTTKLNNKRFVPALMIIKRMSYTRAERRRLIVGYWQKSIKSIMSQIDNEKKASLPPRG